MFSLPRRVALAAACLALAVVMGASLAVAKGPQGQQGKPNKRADRAEPRVNKPREAKPGGKTPRSGKPPATTPESPKSPAPAKPRGGTPTTPRSNHVIAPRSPSRAVPTAQPQSVLQPFGNESSAARPARRDSRSNAKPQRSNAGVRRRATPAQGSADVSRAVSLGPSSWAKAAAGGTPGRGAQRSAAPKTGSDARRAAPEPCPANSCDPVTKLVAFVPAAVKLVIGGLGALALLFLVATVVSRRNLADARSRAVTDALTGLPDHSSIHDHLGESVAAAQRIGGTLAVVLIDLDNFKRINDTYGHLKGDDVLRAVSDKARDELRGNDFVGRYGGEEFMAILPDTEREGAVAVVDRLRRTLWDVEVDGVRELVTASMGVAAYPLDGHSANDLIEAADDALYAAKAGGRNQVRTATALDRQSATRATDERRRLPRAALPQPASIPAQPQ